MVAPAAEAIILNENKPQNNVGINPSLNFNTSPSLLVNPNYGKEIHGPNNTYNIDVHYSTDLTHPELASNKTLSPVQEISVIARGTDPNVIIHSSHITHYVREKEKPIIVSTRNQQSSEYQLLIKATDVLGPLIKAFLNKSKYFDDLSNLKALANNILQSIEELSTINVNALVKQIDGFQIHHTSPFWTSSSKSLNEYWNFVFTLNNLFYIFYRFINELQSFKNALDAFKKELSYKKIANVEFNDLFKDFSQIEKELSSIESELTYLRENLNIAFVLGNEYQFAAGVPFLRNFINTYADLINKYSNIFSISKKVANGILQIREELLVEGLTKGEIQSIENAVNEVLSITGGLTLPEIFNIIGLPWMLPSFIPHNNGYTNNGFSWSYVGDQGNFSFSWNSLTFYHQYVNDVSSSKWYDYYTQTQQIEIKPYYYTYKGRTYKLIEVIYKDNIQVNDTSYYSDNTYYHYYIIDPRTGKLLYEGSEVHPIINMSKENSIITGDLIQPGQEINDILKQYGYQLTQQEQQEINNLQPGQSITINASAGSTGALFEITYLGNDQYQLKSVGRFYDVYDFNNPWTSINERIYIPTYSINTVSGAVMTTGLDIYGTIKTYGTTNINMPYYTATYSINESIPVLWNYNNGQLTFSFGNVMGGVSLQSISLPTLTSAQFQELQSGQIPSGLKPGWYYYPKLHEIVYVNTPQYYLNVGNLRITNQEVIAFVQQYGNNNVLVTNLSNIGNSDELAFIYLTSNGNGEMLIYNTFTGQVVNVVPIKNLKTGNPDYDLIVQLVYDQQYGISNNQILTFQLTPNNLNYYANLNEPIANILGSTVSYVTVDLVNNTVYLQNALQQVIGTKVFKDQASMLNYLQSTFGISPLSIIAVENPQIAQIANPSAAASIASNINSYIYYTTNIIPGTTINYLNYNFMSNTGINLQNIWGSIINGGNLGSNTLRISQELQKIELWQELVKNPNYPFETTNLYSSFSSIPIITETTMNWNQIQYMSNPSYRQEIEQIKGKIADWEAGIQTYNLLSNIYSFLGLENKAQYYQTLAQEAQIYGSPAFYQAEKLGQTEAMIAATAISALPFGILGASSDIADFGFNIEAIARIAPNFIIGGATNTAFGNLIYYTSTGKLLSPQEDIFLFVTSGLMDVGGSILGDTLSESLTNIGIKGIWNSLLSRLPENILVGAGSYVALGEALSLQSTGKWLPLKEAEQLAITGAGFGIFSTAIDIGLGAFGSGILKNPLASSLASGTINALMALPSGNPLMILGSFDIGFVTGIMSGFTFSKIPFIEKSPEVQRVLDTTELGWEIGDSIKGRMIDAGLASYDDVAGLTTTQTADRLKEIYNTLQERIIEKELSVQDKEYLRSKGILGIRDDIILGKEEDFAKYVRDKVPDGEKYYQAQQILKYYTKQLDKYFGGWKINFGENTLIYSIKSGDRTIWGFGSAGKAEEFIGERAVSDITLNVAGIYNAPSDVIDTINYLRAHGMYDDAEMLEKIYDSIKTVKDILYNIKPSKNIEIEFRDYAEEYAKKYGPEYGELISTQMGDTIKEYIQENFGTKAVIYGSESVRQYLDNIARMYGGEVVRYEKDYVIIDRNGNVVWKFRMPGDIDIIIDTKDPGVLEKTAEDIANLLNKTLKTDRFVAQEHLVIDKYTKEHVVDLHMPNEGSEWLNIYARKSNFYDLGLPRPEPYYTDKVGVASLQQTLLDKASAVATLRQLSLADLVDAINSGAKIDNPDYVVSFLKSLLKDADYETQRNVLAEFIARIKPGNRNIYIRLIADEFGISADELSYIDPRYLDIIQQYFYKKLTYIAPATYRLKDTGDTLNLAYLGGDLLSRSLDVKDIIEGREVIKNYETIKELAKEKGIIPPDWTEPNTINMEDIFKSINPFENNIQSPEMVRVGSIVGNINSIIRPESSIMGRSVSSLDKSSSIASMSSMSFGSTSLASMASSSIASTPSSSISSMSSSIISMSSSLSESLTSSSLSSSLSQSTSLSNSLSSSMSASMSSSVSTSMSESLSTSTSTSTSTSVSTSESISAISSTSNPWDFAFIGFAKPKHKSPEIKPDLGRAKRSMSDAAYAFYRIWR